MKKILFIFFIASIFLIFLIFFYSLKFNDGKLHVVVCDVGQGDGIFITTPTNAQILIDGGPDKEILTCLASNMPFWDRSLDAVILTHAHADHYAGLIDVIERYSVKSFYTENVPVSSDSYKLLKLRLAEKNLSASYLTSTDELVDKSGMRITTIWPRLGVLERAYQNESNIDLNALSLVQILEYGEFQLLLTGDAGSNELDQLTLEIGDIDVLKVPHHGSKTGMSQIFLNSIRPELALISSGEGNKYGHPAQFSLELLKDNQIKVLRSDIDGEVEIISDGLRYFVSP